MHSSRVLLRRRLIQFLYTTCPDLVEALKNTRQVYPGTMATFHLEDSVWTHTLMALQSALDQEASTPEDILCALCHDFAKPQTACVRPSKKTGGKKISFLRHAALGTQPAVDFLLALRTSQPELCPVTDEGIARIAAAISMHIDFYDLTSAEDALLFCNRDTVLCQTLLRLLYNDLAGCILDPAAPSYPANQQLMADTWQLLANLQDDQTAGKDDGKKAVQDEGQDEGEKRGLAAPGPGIHLVCGLPGQGKRAFLDSLCARKSLPWYALSAVQVVTPAPKEEASEKEARNRLVRARVLALAPTISKHLATGLVLEDNLCTRESRATLAKSLRKHFPDVPLTCTFVLSGSPKPWLPEPPVPSFGSGLPQPVPELVMPSLLYEPWFAQANIVLACE